MKELQLICAFIFLGLPLNAQSIFLPRKSPKASVSLTIGLTDISIDYSSPAVDNREIWGGLVPYDTIWRAGANEPTTVTFSSDVLIEGKELTKGTYNLLITPGKEFWTVIFNTQENLRGTRNYDPLQDQLHIIVKPTRSAINEERLQYAITEQGFDKGYIRMSWEKIRLFIRLKTDFLALADQSINESIDTTAEENRWPLHLQAADFYRVHKFYDKAIAQLDASMAIKTNSENLWKKAMLYAEKKSFELAVAAGQAAKSIGNTDDTDDFYARNGAQRDTLVESWRMELKEEEKR